VRILEIVFYTAIGGIENYTRDLFTELEHRGHEVVLIAAGERLPGLASPGRRLHFLPELSDGVRCQDGVVHALDAVIREARPDVAHVHFSLGEAVAKLVTRELPTVWFAHTYAALCPSGARLFQRSDAVCTLARVPDHRCLMNAYLQRCNTARPLKLWRSYQNSRIAGASLRLADAIVCDSEYVKQRHLDNGFPGGQIHVLPSPVPIPAALDSDRSPREPLVLFVGRVTAQKGLDYLLRALARIRVPCELAVAGNGYELASQVALAARLGITNRVRFLGPLQRPQVQDLYRRASVVAVPSVWPEPFGMVGPEAMSYGLPVVAFRVGGVPEWLVDRETGFLVEPRDIDGLAQRIEQLLEDAPLARKLGERGRQMAMERFTITHHVDGLERVFASTMAERRR
jgi:glycosyltransferase involved in cell wall biosynthesis